MNVRIALAAACALLISTAVRADEIKVLASGALHDIGDALIPQFENPPATRSR